MAWSLYIARTQFPVPPEKIEYTHNGKNETVTLIDGGEINLIKKFGLTDVKFDLLLPTVPYDFAVYPNGSFRDADYYTELIEYLAVCESFFQLDIYKEMPDGTQLKHFEMSVTLEKYKITEDAGEYGLDKILSLELKQFRNYGIKILQLNDDKITYTVKRVDEKQALIVVDVKENETLYDLCMRELNNADEETVNKIYNLNKSTIDEANTTDVAVVIQNTEEWNDNDYTKRGNTIALLDKSWDGGYKEYNDALPGEHWAEKHVISAYHKGILSDKEYWLTNLDGNIAIADLLALIDRMTGGMVQTYVGRQDVDHWGRNHLDSLCDKRLITEPEKWLDFEGPVTNNHTKALINNALLANTSKYNLSPGMRLRLTA